MGGNGYDLTSFSSCTHLTHGGFAQITLWILHVLLSSLVHDESICVVHFTLHEKSSASKFIYI